MKRSRSLFLLASLIAIAALFPAESDAQQGGFELPVQLIGFPTIIIAVRISNFLKKLSYAVNPNTYRSRARRDLSELNGLSVIEVEKKLVQEMGERVCIYEKICVDYAEESLGRGEENQVFDWQHIFKNYEESPKSKRDFYLLSVFLGDIVGSPELCRQLAKRGRACLNEPPNYNETGPGESGSQIELEPPDIDYLSSEWGRRIPTEVKAPLPANGTVHEHTKGQR